MTTQVIVLNGGSSSGKSAIVRCLKYVLPQPWISFGVDDLIDRLPAAMMGSPSGLTFGPRGEVIVGEEFLQVQHAWMVGIAAMARAGARIVLDEVFLGGAASQERTREYLADLEVLWVGVRCAPDVAAGREIARGDRVIGMAVSQAEIVHEGVRYDVEVDTSLTESLGCARVIMSHVV
ncbi:chloramphenicol phosphotransferase CPT [Plantactinospora sp. S1510]|uniref:Chloramphenicol phosphotransferase CPT n=1 Tax=Plantactinospora alkalitolerans TaxID=2789879 RepID=A0ABS0H4K6_9ACTN|nr:chloramphenicol phosphotransferase CPT [Plantactinospora alkalitolerans]MBF9133246.1 chloramphenicol phosphotransferase CPT [Plantactinospora alkalitolerans]